MIHDFSNSSSGMGNIPAIIASGGQIAAGIVPGVLASTGAIAVGSLAIPVIGVAIAGVTLAVSLFLNRNAAYFAEEKGTTDIVNQAEVLMKQNLAAWNSSDKTIGEQDQAIANFNNIWSQVVQACSSSAYSQGSNSTGLSPGQRCVSDRQRGGQWDWFSYYYDPIAGDPNVKASNVGSQITNVGTGVMSIVDNFANSGGGGLGSYLPLILLGVAGYFIVREIT